MATKQTEVVVIGAGYAGLLATVRLAGRLRGSPWHSLYLRPEPQGHGALRPTLPNSPPPADSERRSTCASPSTVGAL